jgi:hypothetical protein
MGYIPLLPNTFPRIMRVRKAASQGDIRGS